MANIYQIGAGMVGQAMSLDLANEHTVFLADLHQPNLEIVKNKNSSIQIQQLDVTDKYSLTQFIKPADIVLLAVPGFLGFSVLKTIIETGKNVVDISFSPENTLSLNSLAKQNNVTAIVDAGVAPGIPNFVLGYHDGEQDIQSFEYYVGGLPKNPIPPYNYKAPFSPIDVIEEYTRPARMKINGDVITKSALSDCETFFFEEVGELEGFNTDGLRSILTTMAHIPNMKEKTLRYPHHASLMKKLRDEGKFDSDQIEKTASELFKEWKLGENEPEFTIMDIKIDGEQESIHYHLFDEFDYKSNTASMSRTTGYTATATINLLLNNNFNEFGVFPPELVGKVNGCWHFIQSYLQSRGINIVKK